MFNLTSVVLCNCTRCRHRVIDWLMKFCNSLPHSSIKARLSSSTDSNFRPRKTLCCEAPTQHNPLDWCPGCWGPRLTFTFLTANKLFYLRDFGWRSRWPGTSAASCPVSVPFCVSSLQQAVKSTPRPAFWRDFFQQFPRAPSFMLLQVFN